jgi:isopentenyl-diphosphate Delta-isomerase
MESNVDPNAAERKKDHIQLALEAQTLPHLLDKRFNYEPILAGNRVNTETLQLSFLGRHFNAPIWVSSMTGGTQMAKVINQNLAKLCHEFGLGMGLGSCRRLLYDDTFFEDFNLRKIIGDQALYANLGIAQVEKLISEGATHKMDELINRLQVDGLIIHINPLQEWMQPEGDRYHKPPIDTIKNVLDHVRYKIIVKEVGHGMGPKSIEALMNLPLEAIEFAAFGGTNFSKIEIFRSLGFRKDLMENFSLVGHTAEEMVSFVNQVKNPICKQMIISGGIKNVLDGYHLIEKCEHTAVMGLASTFLEYARNDYETLKEFTGFQIEGLAMAHQLLTIKN